MPEVWEDEAERLDEFALVLQDWALNLQTQAVDCAKRAAVYRALAAAFLLSTEEEP